METARMFTSLAFLVFVVASVIGAVTRTLSPPGTTKNLKEIFIGRCWDFQRKTQENQKIPFKDCDELWKLFYKSFAFKNPCKLSFKDYDEFFKAALGSRIDKILFWSGTYDVAHILADSGKNYVTLEDTLVGSFIDPRYIVNGLEWCGQVSGSKDGINYDTCPARSPECDRTTPFWGLASQTFAEQAGGAATVVMVNGTRGGRPAYSPSSFFAKFELPNLPASKVDRMDILVVNDIGVTPRGSCKEKSVQAMINELLKRKIKPHCKEMPADVKHILCKDHPTAGECLFAN